jgi:chromosome segregation ATPase
MTKELASQIVYKLEGRLNRAEWERDNAYRARNQAVQSANDWEQRTLDAANGIIQRDKDIKELRSALTKIGAKLDAVKTRNDRQANMIIDQRTRNDRQFNMIMDERERHADLEEYLFEVMEAHTQLQLYLSDSALLTEEEREEKKDWAKLLTDLNKEREENRDWAKRYKNLHDYVEWIKNYNEELSNTCDFLKGRNKYLNEEVKKEMAKNKDYDELLSKSAEDMMRIFELLGCYSPTEQIQYINIIIAERAARDAGKNQEVPSEGLKVPSDNE